jgi:hypothetical protein
VTNSLLPVTPSCFTWLMSPDEIHDRWCVDLDAISRRFHLLHVRAAMWEDIDNELVRTQHPGSGILTEVLRTMFGEAQGVAIRTLLDDRRATDSMVRLVRDMRDNCSVVLTRERHRLLFTDDLDDSQIAKEFDRLAGQRGLDHLPRRLFIQMEDDLLAAGRAVKDSVDEYVAHKKKRPTAQSHSYDDLDTCIRSLGRTYITIGQILTGATHIPEPYTAAEWRLPFQAGLFGPGAPPFEGRHLEYVS